jgi:flagellar motility protein MotE (MotC chaperone)
MTRIIEIAAMAIGGLSLFLVAFVGFASLSGRDMSQVAVIGKLFPKPAEDEGAHGTGAGADEAEGTREEHGGERGKGLSDAAVVEASLGVLSAWTLPSPYSTTELRGLSEEIKEKRAELEEAEHALGRRERAVADDERELEERMKTLAELQQHLEVMQTELTEREQAVARREATLEAGADARWTAVAGVIAAIEEPAAAAKRLQEYQPDEAAKILRALNDDERAGAILNAFDEARWKEYVGAYTAERARAGGKGKRK